MNNLMTVCYYTGHSKWIGLCIRYCVYLWPIDCMDGDTMMAFWINFIINLTTATNTLEIDVNVKLFKYHLTAKVRFGPVFMRHCMAYGTLELEIVSIFFSLSFLVCFCFFSRCFTQPNDVANRLKISSDFLIANQELTLPINSRQQQQQQRLR